MDRSHLRVLNPLGWDDARTHAEMQRREGIGATLTGQGSRGMLGVSGQKEREMADERNEVPKLTQNRFLRKLEGREVLIVFLDGKAVQGVLTGYDIYNLFVQREDGLEVAVFKHSIKYLHAAPGKGGAKAPPAGKGG
jgi:sRNA-binding regulator protein Hfq